MEKEKNIYSYRPCVSVLFHKESGISHRRIQLLWEKGVLGEQDLILMGALAELTVLTGKLIEKVFWLPEIPSAFCILRTQDGKNPYRGMIRKLLDLGILTEARFAAGDVKIGPKLYGLASGARKWGEESGAFPLSYFTEGLPYRSGNRKVDFRQIPYATLLMLLSLNQFHLKAISAHDSELFSYGRYWLERDVPVNLYRGIKHGWILVCAFRGKEYQDVSLEQNVTRILNKSMGTGLLNEKISILLLVESLDEARRIWQMFPDDRKADVLFITDRDVFEHNPFHFLFRFKGMDEYVRCGLTLA